MHDRNTLGCTIVYSICMVLWDYWQQQLCNTRQAREQADEIILLARRLGWAGQNAAAAPLHTDNWPSLPGMTLWQLPPFTSVAAAKDVDYIGFVHKAHSEHTCPAGSSHTYPYLRRTKSHKYYAAMSCQSRPPKLRPIRVHMHDWLALVACFPQQPAASSAPCCPLGHWLA